MQGNPVHGTHFRRPWCQRHESGRVCLVSGHTSNLGRPSLQVLTFLEEVRFIAWRLRCPFMGNDDGARGIWGNTQRVWASALRLEPTLKMALCHTNPDAWTEYKYRKEREVTPLIFPCYKKAFRRKGLLLFLVYLYSMFL